MKSFVDFLYSVLIGASIALFVGFGIWTFYSGPKAPEFPKDNYGYYGASAPTPAQQKQIDADQKKFNDQMTQYDKLTKPYNKNVSIIALIAGVIVYLIGLMAVRKNEIKEGFELGGVFTLFYAIGRALSVGSKPWVFSGISLTVIMLILLVQFRGRAIKLWPTRSK